MKDLADSHEDTLAQLEEAQLRIEELEQQSGRMPHRKPARKQKRHKNQSTKHSFIMESQSIDLVAPSLNAGSQSLVITKSQSGLEDLPGKPRNAHALLQTLPIPLFLNYPTLPLNFARMMPLVTASSISESIQRNLESLQLSAIQQQEPGEDASADDKLEYLIKLNQSLTK